MADKLPPFRKLRVAQTIGLVALVAGAIPTIFVLWDSRINDDQRFQCATIREAPSESSGELLVSILPLDAMSIDVSIKKYRNQLFATFNYDDRKSTENWLKRMGASPRTIVKYDLMVFPNGEQVELSAKDYTFFEAHLTNSRFASCIVAIAKNSEEVIVNCF
jgi:hypothetical protein